VKIFRFFIPIIWVISVAGCFNPFFPEKGNPPQVASSPQRTIQLFREAYERRDIFAFEDLIYDMEEFSSYTQVSEDYTSTFNKLLWQPKVFIDDIFPQGTSRFLPRGRSYFELKWEQEYLIHRKMFEWSDEIVFLPSLVARETFFEINGTDTVSALVKTEDSRIRIRYGGQDFTMNITGQVFAMKRKNGFWKIWKWIELN